METSDTLTLLANFILSKSSILETKSLQMFGGTAHNSHILYKVFQLHTFWIFSNYFQCKISKETFTFFHLIYNKSYALITPRDHTGCEEIPS